MSTTVGAVIIEVKANTAKLVSGMDKAQRTVSRSVDNIKKRILQIAVAYAGIQGIRAFKGMISDSIDAADSTGKLAQTLGMTSNELSKLKYAATYADVPISKLSAGLSAMIRRTANFQRNGGGAAATALKELGVTADYANKHFTSTDTTFKILIDRLSKMPDGFRKTAIAQDLFSKAASGVLRLSSDGAEGLKKLGDEAERFGEVVPDYIAKMSAMYNDTITHMEARAKGAKNLISYGILPSLLAFFKTIDKWFIDSFGTGKDAIKNFGDIAEKVFKGLIEGAGFLKDAFNGVLLVVKSIEFLFYGLAGVASLAIQPIVSLINGLIDANNKLADTWLGEKAGMGKIGWHLESALPSISKKMKELGKEIDVLYNKIANQEGKKTANAFEKTFLANLKNLKKMVGQKYTIPDVKGGLITDTSNGRSEADYIKALNLEKIADNEKLKVQLGINKALRDRALIGKEYGTVQKDYLTKANALSDALDKQTMDKAKLLTLQKKEKEILNYIEISKKQGIKHTRLDSELAKNKKAQLEARITKEQESNVILQTRYDKEQAFFMEEGSIFQGMKKAYDDYANNIPTDFQSGMKIMQDAISQTSDAFVKFVQTGKINFTSLANSIINDMIRMEVEKKIVSPLLGFATNLLMPSTTPSMAFMNDHMGAVPYASGGVANSPQLAVFGENSRPEAFVPLPDGKNIPVKMSGVGGGTNVVINIENKSGQEVSMKQVSQMTKTNSRGQQETVLGFVMDGYARNVNGFRDIMKGGR